MKIVIFIILSLFSFCQCHRDKIELLYNHGTIYLKVINEKGDNLLDPDLKKYNLESIYIRYSSNGLQDACSEIISETDIVIFLNWDVASDRIPAANNSIFIELDQNDMDTINFDFNDKFWSNIKYNGDLIDTSPTDVVEIVAVNQ